MSCRLLSRSIALDMWKCAAPSFISFVIRLVLWISVQYNVSVQLLCFICLVGECPAVFWQQ